jgi:hypothetical protein
MFNMKMTTNKLMEYALTFISLAFIPKKEVAHPTT